MGNTPTSIGLRTDKTTYKAGETLTGRVYVSVPAQPVQAIMLSILGREHALVHFTTSKNEGNGRHQGTHTRDHYDESTNEFLRQEYPLQRFPTGQLNPGQYEFPFSIQLPSNLPSSMRCENGQSYCCVEYKLKATLVKPSSSSRTFKIHADPSSEQTLTVLATPPPSDSLHTTSLQLPMEEVPVNSCCCHNKGTMALQAQFDKTTVQPRDKIGVQFRCRNQSTVKVRRVRVQLEQIIEWTGSPGMDTHDLHQERVKRMLDRHEMDASQFPELHKLRQRKQRRDSGFVLHEQEPFQNEDDWKYSTIQVPADVHDSYQGRSIRVRHLLSVQLITKGCCTTDPDATTMIEVYRTGVPSSASATGDSSYCGNNSTATRSSPSAPSFVYDKYKTTESTSASSSHWDSNTSSVAASAPSEVYDAAGSFIDSSEPGNTTPFPIMAQAQVLPLDWNAQIAEVVAIPMAEAIVLETVDPTISRGPLDTARGYK